ncbi:MAG: hypothetical protein OEN55_03755, partial [Alphaproteobacteria bacterium]|nr:hypothetical protein [Alphaproteobacteria bacterium]
GDDVRTVKSLLAKRLHSDRYIRVSPMLPKGKQDHAVAIERTGRNIGAAGRYPFRVGRHRRFGDRRQIVRNKF